MTKTAQIVAVSITAAKHPRIRTLTATCGTTFRYKNHTEYRGVTALLMSCVCRHGHGVGKNPWLGWVSTTEAKMTLTDIPVPVSSYALLSDDEIAALDADVITLDQIGVCVPAAREALTRDDVAAAA